MSRESASSRQRDLTPELFERLLERFSANRIEAGERYNGMRARLVQFFVWQGIEAPEDHADEVINRVARRIGEGENIPNLPGYFLGVARLVALEVRARRVRENRAHHEFARLAHSPAAEAQDESALTCLDRCLARLTPERRRHLLAYYSGDEGTRIATRQELAAELGVDMGALRNRMLRARQQLEACVEQCLERQRSVRDETGAPITDSKRSRSKGDEDA
jgi:DNA-directed RNA polymerase specialized sigma24 family protein